MEEVGSKFDPFRLDERDKSHNLLGFPVPDQVLACVAPNSGLDNEEKDRGNEFLGFPVRQVNWLELPLHLTHLVADKFVHIWDLILFGAVCPCWRTVYNEIRKHRQQRLRRQLPLLMLPTEFNHDGQTRSCYSLSDNSVSKFQFPVPHNTFCQGSCHGWLVTVRTNFEVFLLNPFLSLNNEIRLPPLTAFELDVDDVLYNGYIIKAVLSANPTLDPNYAVMAIHGQRKVLSFCRPGDKSWTCLDRKYNLIIDIIYYKDQFYAVNHFGAVCAFDMNHPRPKVSLISPPARRLLGDSKYIVESSGDLLLVIKIQTNVSGDSSRQATYFTNSFQVFKLDTERIEWVGVNSLGEHVLFLGENSSMSLSSSDFPECKPNCIYFTDDYHDGFGIRVYDGGDGAAPHDMGVFNMEDGCIEPHYRLEFESIIPPPIWIEPML